MFVYLVIERDGYGRCSILGAYSDYVSAREYELKYDEESDWDSDWWVEIRKVEMNKNITAMGI